MAFFWLFLRAKYFLKRAFKLAIVCQFLLLSPDCSLMQTLIEIEWYIIKPFQKDKATCIGTS